MRRLYLYTTAACHLCEIAEEVLAGVLPGRALELEKVDISESDELMARYGIRIPVLRLEDSGDELGWPFDAESVAGFLEAHAGSDR